VAGLRVYVIVHDATTAAAVTRAAGADAIMVRFGRPDDMPDVVQALKGMPPAWKTAIDQTTAVVLGAHEVASTITGFFAVVRDDYLDAAGKQAKFLSGQTSDVVRVLKTPQGQTVYCTEQNWVSERTMAGNVRVIEKGTDRLPTTSRETTLSKMGRYTSGAETVLGAMNIGAVAYASAGQVIVAHRQGDNVDVAIYATQGAVRIASQVVSLSRYAKTGGGQALAVVASAVGLLEAGKAAWEFGRATSAWDKQEKGQQVISVTANAGLSVVAALYPPAAVIDPTFRATVAVLNRWIPGSKDDKELTAAALADIGTAFSFMASYLGGTVPKETAEQALRKGVDETKKRVSSGVFIAPK